MGCHLSSASEISFAAQNSFIFVFDELLFFCKHDFSIIAEGWMIGEQKRERRLMAFPFNDLHI